MSDLVLSVLMIAGIALTLGGMVILRKGGNRRQGILMLVAAIVMFANVYILQIPVPEQNQPVVGNQND